MFSSELIDEAYESQLEILKRHEDSHKRQFNPLQQQTPPSNPSASSGAHYATFNAPTQGLSGSNGAHGATPSTSSPSYHTFAQASPTSSGQYSPHPHPLTGSGSTTSSPSSRQMPSVDTYSPQIIVDQREPLSNTTEMIYRADVSIQTNGHCTDWYFRHWCRCIHTMTTVTLHPPWETVCASTLKGATCSRPNCPYQHPNSTVLRLLLAEAAAELSILKSLPGDRSDLVDPQTYRIRTLNPKECLTKGCSSPTCFLQHKVVDSTRSHVSGSSSASSATYSTSSNQTPPASSQPIGLSSSQPSNHAPATAQPSIAPSVVDAPYIISAVQPTEPEWAQVLEILVSSNSSTLLKLEALTRITNAPIRERFNTVGAAAVQPITWTLFHGTTYNNASSIAKQGFNRTKIKRQGLGSGHYFTAAPIMAYFWSGDQGMIRTVVLVEVVASSTKEVPQSDGAPFYIVGDDAAILPRYIMRLSMLG